MQPTVQSVVNCFRQHRATLSSGADLSGIELRCFAQMLPDNGEYGRMILEGDIHQMNADNLGISGDQAKTVQYAMLYGSGDQRLGEILGQGPQRAVNSSDATSSRCQRLRCSCGRSNTP